MTSQTHPHILVAAACFVGICFLLFTGLRISGASDMTVLDEITIGAAVFFLGSCGLSYASMRAARKAQLLETLADISFLIGIVSLAAAMIAYAVGVI